MLAKGGNRGERLSTVVALDLLSAVCVHSLVSAKIGKLGICLQANFTLERLDTGMDMLMLFETARCGKSLSAVGTCVTTCAMML